jgi:plastocyanin
MMNKRRQFAGWITVAALCAAAAFFWASSRAPVAYGFDVSSRSMGAGPAEALVEPGIWERFEHEKKAAPESELPAQF